MDKESFCSDLDDECLVHDGYTDVVPLLATEPSALIQKSWTRGLYGSTIDDFVKSYLGAVWPPTMGPRRHHGKVELSAEESLSERDSSERSEGKSITHKNVPLPTLDRIDSAEISGENHTSELSSVTHQRDTTHYSCKSSQKTKFCLKAICIMITVTSLVVTLVLWHARAFPLHGTLRNPENNDELIRLWTEPKLGGTHGTWPVPAHSHNDYTRGTPLFDALHMGFTSVEADVWWKINYQGSWLDAVQKDLWLGHLPADAGHMNTITNRYINPIVEILDILNRDRNGTDQRPHGVFAKNPEQTLVLLVDLKTKSYEGSIQALNEQLKPLRDRGYLTRWDPAQKTRIDGPVTVVVSGDVKNSDIKTYATHQDMFLDAPLDRVWKGWMSRLTLEERKKIHPNYWVTAWVWGIPKEGTNDGLQYTTETAYYASLDLPRRMKCLTDDTQKPMIRSMVKAAHLQGLQVRYWATPEWPEGLRDCFYKDLLAAGADIINTDTPKAFTTGNWRRGTAWEHSWPLKANYPPKHPDGHFASNGTWISNHVPIV